MDRDNKLEYVLERKLCKENLSRMYGSCIVFFMAFLIAGSMGFYGKGEAKSEVLAAMLPVAMSCFCIAGFLVSRLVIKEAYRKYQKPCYLAFWGVMMAGMLFWIMQYSDPLQITILYGIFLFVFSMVPILPVVCQISYFAAQAVWILRLMFQNQSMISEYLFCIVSWNVFSGFLIYARYQKFYQKVSSEYKIKEAIILSETDSMTKLLNRRGLERSIESVWPHCVRQGVPTAVVMLDIDNFKKYNDAFGHPQGDKCICQIAKEIKKAAKRKTDLAARVGGEEFLIVLNDLDHAQAVQWAKNLKFSIDNLAIPHTGRDTLPVVTVSMGLAWIVPPNGKEISMEDSFEYLKLESDKQLYRAKKSGRACICYEGQIYGKRGINEYISLLKEKKKAV